MQNQEINIFTNNKINIFTDLAAAKYLFDNHVFFSGLVYAPKQKVFKKANIIGDAEEWVKITQFTITSEIIKVSFAEGWQCSYKNIIDVLTCLKFIVPILE